MKKKIDLFNLVCNTLKESDKKKFEEYESINYKNYDNFTYNYRWKFYGSTAEEKMYFAMRLPSRPFQFDKLRYDNKNLIRF